MDPNYLQSLHEVLAQALLSDAKLINSVSFPDDLILPSFSWLFQAMAQLNQVYYKTPECIKALCIILANPVDPPVRVLAAQEMRQRILKNNGKQWSLLPRTERESIKSNLLGLVQMETSEFARRAAAQVVAAVAAYELSHSSWPQLIPFVTRICCYGNVLDRKVGIYLCSHVLEVTMDGIEDHVDGLLTLFEKLLVDPRSLETRIITVRAVGALASHIDDFACIQKLLPMIFKVISQSVLSQDIGDVEQVFDALETLIILEVPMGEHVSDLATSLLEYSVNRSAGTEIRVLALSTLNLLIRSKTSKIESKSMIERVLTDLMPITAKPQSVYDNEISRSALQSIEGLFVSLPPCQVYPIFHSLIKMYTPSPDPLHRRAVMIVLGVSVEGCSEFMTPYMPEVWSFIERCLQEPDLGVRKATCETVSRLSVWLEDECASRHSTLIPALVNLIHNHDTQLLACSTLDGLLDISGEISDQCLQLAIEQLSCLLDTAPLTVIAIVIGAIGRAAGAVKGRFLPFLVPLMHRLEPFLTLTREGEDADIRAITMEAIGLFAEAVGKENFQPYFHGMMKQAFEGIDIDNLKESSFGFFASMARVFGKEFAVHLPNVVPPLLATCEESERDEEVSNFSGASVESEESDNVVHVTSGIVVEKQIAADTIGTLFSATREHFLPYIERCVLVLVSLLPHPYDGVRKNATESLLKIVRTFCALGKPEEWRPGSFMPALDQNMKDLISHTFRLLLHRYERETDESVVYSLFVGFAKAIYKIGPGFIEGRVEQLCSIAIQVLNQEAWCQKDSDQDGAQEHRADDGFMLVSSAGDVVAALASVIGPEFAPAFNTFYPSIAKYYTKDHSRRYRSFAVGCLANIVSSIKSAVTSHSNDLFQLFLCALKDPEAEVLSEAAFGIGALIEYSEDDLSSQYPTILTALWPLFDVTPSTPAGRLNARDNATGVIARMILQNHAAVPLDQVMPVFIRALPLQRSYHENEAVFRAIFHLFRTCPAEAHPYIGKLLKVFMHVLDSNGPEHQLTDSTRRDLVILVNALHGQSPQEMQEAGFAVFSIG
ncbi:hypothetical protein AMATHDRAFT_4295 [Amanita thiersii Skay4041]|uniref:Importin N-terminal domain-containing protein n=1 Tax=Amanita thiersii Skay4041 TaxID=703135 RepID=A0A2A9NQL1_9AGAR|nr:hypothetical protein AMATHDRAFT_4295 [Amanita thiersii Skay4041]